MKHARTKSHGYTLIEIMLAVIVLLAATVGVFLMYKPAMLKAGVEREQKHLGSIVRDIQGGFGRTQGSYAGLSNRTLYDLTPDGVRYEDNNTIVSEMGDTILVRPATVRQDGDAFDVVYQGLNKQKCIAYVKTFFPQSYTILVGSVQDEIQNTNTASAGRLTDDTILYAACLADEFATNSGVVVFRFFEPIAVGGSVFNPACGCTAETQEQALPCGAAQSGSIYQERTSACTGGTPSCPAAEWSPWTTTSNTCSGVSVPLPASAPVAAPASPCFPSTATQNSACPAGQRGQVTRQRTSTCATPTSAPTWGAWVVTQDTCATPSPETATCGFGTQSQNLACPVGQIGAVVQRRTSECATPFSAPTFGPWVEVSRSCRVACADANDCCQPLPHQYRPLSCPAGFWGAGTERRTSWCDAVNVSSPVTPNWNAWLLNTGAPCAACPAPSTATETRHTAQTGLCPADQYGSTSWEREETRSQTTTFNCPAGTQVLPAPTISAWTGWTPTGATRNNVSSCASCPANTSTVEVDWPAASAPCPLGQVGTHTWARELTRTRSETYACPAGTLTAPSATVSYTAWTATGSIRSEVNTCVVPVCSGASSETQNIGANGTCPLGQTGTITWLKEQVRTRACSAPPTWDAWSAWGDTGATSNLVDTCVAAACSGSASDVQWIAHNEACPIGEAGTNSWEAEEARTRTCSAPPAWDAWGAWTETGTRRNVVYTCAPVACAGPASETQWLGTVGACNVGYTGTKTWEREQIRSHTCTTPPAWDAWGAWSDTGNTRNLSDTCVLSCVAPAPTSTTVYINRTNEPRTIACAAGYTGSISQERTRQEIGTDTTTWTCPGPSPSNSTTWSGTYNYGGWFTVNHTCVPVAAPTCYDSAWSTTGPFDYRIGDGYLQISYTMNGTYAGAQCNEIGNDVPNEAACQAANGLVDLATWGNSCTVGETYTTSLYDAPTGGWSATSDITNTCTGTCSVPPPPTFHYGCGFSGPNGPPSGFMEMNECAWDPSAYWQTDATVGIGTSFDGTGFPVLDETIYRVEMTSVQDGATCFTYRCNVSVNMSGDYYSHTRIRVIRRSDNVEVFNEVLIVDFSML